MKVSLAAQTFSASVADALTFCEGKKYPDFENSGPTIEFCKYMNNIFDFLNTRNFLGKVKHKRPVYIEQENEINEFINDAIKYIESLKDYNNTPVIGSRRKTGFRGLIVCLKSTRNLIYDIIQTKQLDFILTYKMSQDHIEMLFSAIRSRGGFNNNPSAAQFEAAYKKTVDTH